MMENKFLVTLIRSYQIQNGRKAETALAHYKSLPSLDEIIHHAAILLTQTERETRINED